MNKRSKRVKKYTYGAKHAIRVGTEVYFPDEIINAVIDKQMAEGKTLKDALEYIAAKLEISFSTAKRIRKGFSPPRLDDAYIDILSEFKR